MALLVPTGESAGCEWPGAIDAHFERCSGPAVIIVVEDLQTRPGEVGRFLLLRWSDLAHDLGWRPNEESRR